MHAALTLKLAPGPRPATGATVAFDVAFASPTRLEAVLWAFVNGTQWGAPSTLGRAGRARLLLPIPHAGEATVDALVLPTGVKGCSGNFTVGTPISAWAPLASAKAAALRVHVADRAIVRMGGRAGAPKLGLQWEPWFSPRGQQNIQWATHEAVPLLGYYSSFDPSVIKQHAIWWAGSGVEWINVDWTNNLWGKSSLSEMDAFGWAVVNGTSVAVDTYRQLEEEGIPCPKIALMMGLANGQPIGGAHVAAINEQIAWVRARYPPASMVHLDGKPLLLMLDHGEHASSREQVDATGFTLRWNDEIGFMLRSRCRGRGRARGVRRGASVAALAELKESPLIAPHRTHVTLRARSRTRTPRPRPSCTVTPTRPPFAVAMQDPRHGPPRTVLGGAVCPVAWLAPDHGLPMPRRPRSPASGLVRPALL